MRKISIPKCDKCGKTAYPAYSIALPYKKVPGKEPDPPKIFHEACFRCATCKKALNVSSYVLDHGTPYCKVHAPKAAPTAVKAHVSKAAPTAITDSPEVKQTSNAPKRVAEGFRAVQKDIYQPHPYIPGMEKECTDLIEMGKRDNQTIFFREPKKDDKASIIPQVTLHIPYETAIDDKLFNNIKRELNETLGEENYVLLGLEKGSVIAIIGLIAKIKGKIADADAENGKKVIEMVKKVMVKTFDCLGGKKADSVGVTRPPTSAEVKKCLLDPMNMSRDNVEDPTRLSTLIPAEVEKLYDAPIAELKKNEKNLEHNLKLKSDSGEYAKKFEKELIRAKRESMYEYKIASISVMENDWTTYETNKARCPNCKSMFLFHGSGVDAVSNIAVSGFRHGSRFLYGIGTYMSESLDTARSYSSSQGSGDKNTFWFIGSEVYYDETKVETNTSNMVGHWDPLSGMSDDEIKKKYPDKVVKENGIHIIKSNHYYVIFERKQILPMFAVAAQRNEYCVIWRDPHHSDTDGMYADYLNKLKFITAEKTGYNMYFEPKSDEALKLIERKKEHSKIILISNIGPDLGGKKFVEDARDIIGGNVMVLFSSLDTGHLEWLKDFPNALFSNEESFYKEFITNFNEGGLRNLKRDVEDHYNTTFPEYTDGFMKYPYYQPF